MPCRSITATLLATLLLACVGTDVGNPDGDSGNGGIGDGGSGPGAGGGGGSSGDEGGVVPTPDRLELGSACSGGLARSWLELRNRGEAPLLVELQAEQALSLHPATLSVEAQGSAQVAVIYAAPVDAIGRQQGTIELATDGGSAPSSVPWGAEAVAEPMPRGATLCGGEGPCEQLRFEGAAGETTELTVVLANDGCTDLTLTGLEVESEGDAPEFVGDLPVTLQPGERFAARLRIGMTGGGDGSVRLLAEEAQEAFAAIPFVVLPAGGGAGG